VHIVALLSRDESLFGRLPDIRPCSGRGRPLCQHVAATGLSGHDALAIFAPDESLHPSACCFQTSLEDLVAHQVSWSHGFKPPAAPISGHPKM
jgi:hypothetical protein